MSALPGESNAPAPGRRARSLRVRVGLVVGGALILLFAAFTAISTWTTAHFFAGLQDRLTAQRIERVALVINQLALARGRLARDNAEWDETYDFIEGTNPEYLAGTYGPGVNSAGQDVVIVYNAKREIVGTVQSGHADPLAAPLPDELASLGKGSLLDDEARSGLIAVGGRVLALSAWPVRRTKPSGLSNGWLVFGTYFTPERKKALHETAGAVVEFLPERPVETGERRAITISRQAIGTVTASYAPTRAWSGTGHVSDARLEFPSLTDAPGVTLAMGVDPVIFQHAIQARNSVMITTALFGLIFIAIGLASVEWSVLRPLAALDRELGELSRSKGEIGQLKTRRDDEIGRLANSANRLLGRVVAGQREALRQEELLSGVLDSAIEGVAAYQCVRDIAGDVVDLRMALLNHSGEKTLRVAEGEMIGKTIKETHPRLVETGVYERLVRAATTRQAATFETYDEGPDLAGWYRYSVAPWGDGVVLTFTDISERKIREHELAASLVELERFNAAMIGREERILEMKREVNMLRRQLGLSERYEVHAGDA